MKPYVTQFSGARSPASTAEMILRLLGALLSGGQVLTGAQVKLEGELFGMHGVVGAPIVLTLNGVDRVVPYELSAHEQALVKASLLPTRPSRARSAANATRCASSSGPNAGRATCSCRAAPGPAMRSV